MIMPNGEARFKGDEWHGDGIHSAADWAAERRETEEYVSILGRRLMNGGTIAESTLGEALIFLEDLEQAPPRRRPKRQEKISRYAAWERDMKASRGHWTQHADKENLLLIRQDSEDSMAGLYIRVRGSLIDAGVYRGAPPYLDEAGFESLWDKTSLSPSDAMDFVLQRARC